MKDKKKLLQKIISGSRNVRFRGKLVSACRSGGIYGFRMKDYHINIFYSEEDDGYIADIPDLPHCSAFGESHEKALLEVLEAKKAWIEAARANRKNVPEPQYRPVIYQVA